MHQLIVLALILTLASFLAILGKAPGPAILLAMGGIACASAFIIYHKEIP